VVTLEFEMFRNLQLLMLAAGIILALIAVWLLFKPRPRGVVAKLGGVTWRRNQFCRGWLITGDTGSGKTSSGINQTCASSLPERADAGAACALTRKVSIGKRWRRWPATTGANRT
jgi:hypothetical protein